QQIRIGLRGGGAFHPLVAVGRPGKPGGEHGGDGAEVRAVVRRGELGGEGVQARRLHLRAERDRDGGGPAVEEVRLLLVGGGQHGLRRGGARGDGEGGEARRGGHPQGLQERPAVGCDGRHEEYLVLGIGCAAAGG